MVEEAPELKQMTLELGVFGLADVTKAVEIYAFPRMDQRIIKIIPVVHDKLEWRKQRKLWVGQS